MSMLKSRHREVNTGVCVCGGGREQTSGRIHTYLFTMAGRGRGGHTYSYVLIYMYLNAEVLFQQECIPSTFNNLFLNLRKKSNLSSGRMTVSLSSAQAPGVRGTLGSMARLAPPGERWPSGALGVLARGGWLEWSSVPSRTGILWSAACRQLRTPAPVGLACLLSCHCEGGGCAWHQGYRVAH